MQAQKGRRCRVCRKEVGQLGRHMARCHQTKYWGYKCPHCPVINSRLDATFMRRHLSTHEENSPLEACRVIIPEGYVSLISCPLCDVKTFRDKEMSEHFYVTHPPTLPPLEEYLKDIDSVCSPPSFPAPPSPSKPDETVTTPVYEDITLPGSPPRPPTHVTVSTVQLISHQIINGQLIPVPQCQPVSPKAKTISLVDSQSPISSPVAPTTTEDIEEFLDRISAQLS